MGLLKDISKKHKTVSIIGMAKNAGKTTALNFLIEEAYDEDIALGITSTGRDGETVDLVTETEKPKVFLYENTIVSVPTQLFELAEAGLEILSTTEYRTSLGPLYLCRVKDSGYVEIAGPVASSETKKMCDEMLSQGAEFVLIDGAIDRKSVASPDSSDAVILSTGAVLSRDIQKVVRETVHVTEIYNLPVLPVSKVREAIIESFDEKNILIIKGSEAEALDVKTGLGRGREINEALTEDVDYVYIPGALTEGMIRDLDSSKFKRTEFIIKDPTKIFVDAVNWNKLKKKGFKLWVLSNIEICGITVNPFAPEGYSFDSDLLCQKIREALPDIPVIDVRK